MSYELVDLVGVSRDVPLAAAFATLRNWRNPERTCKCKIIQTAICCVSVQVHTVQAGCLKAQRAFHPKHCSLPLPSIPHKLNEPAVRFCTYLFQFLRDMRCGIGSHARALAQPRLEHRHSRLRVSAKRCQLLDLPLQALGFSLSLTVASLRFLLHEAMNDTRI